jgi:hypothetical protein
LNATGGVALLVAAALVAGCGSEEPVATTVGPGTEPQDVEAAPSARPPAPETSISLDVPKGTYPAIWVREGQAVEMRTEPGAREVVGRFGDRSQFGSASVFGVVDQRGKWAGVTTTLLPNNELGWIRLDPDRVDAGWTPYSVTVDLSERTASLLDRGRERLSFPVTIGAPESPTPTGRFSVTDTFVGLRSAAYGCCALAISATQPQLPSGWLGGRTIAIHGTAGPLGVAASHGCVRATDGDVAKLVRSVPLGTPVFIRA